jgi:hypothetical protein
MKQTAVEWLISELRKYGSPVPRQDEEEAIEMERQQQGYSEEEVEKLLIKCKDRFGGSDLDDYVEDSKVIDWFEQNKKK